VTESGDGCLEPTLLRTTWCLSVWAKWRCHQRAAWANQTREETPTSFHAMPYGTSLHGDGLQRSPWLDCGANGFGRMQPRSWSLLRRRCRGRIHVTTSRPPGGSHGVASTRRPGGSRSMGCPRSSRAVLGKITRMLALTMSDSSTLLVQTSPDHLPGLSRAIQSFHSHSSGCACRGGLGQRMARPLLSHD